MEEKKDGDGKSLITPTAPISFNLPTLDESDDRRRCLTCTGLRGDARHGWQCNRHRAAHVGRDLPRELVELPQRCPAYIAITYPGPGPAADLPVQAPSSAMTRP